MEKNLNQTDMRWNTNFNLNFNLAMKYSSHQNCEWCIKKTVSDKTGLMVLFIFKGIEIEN